MTKFDYYSYRAFTELEAQGWSFEPAMWDRGYVLKVPEYVAASFGLTSVPPIDIEKAEDIPHIVEGIEIAMRWMRQGQLRAHDRISIHSDSDD